MSVRSLYNILNYGTLDSTTSMSKFPSASFIDPTGCILDAITTRYLQMFKLHCSVLSFERPMILPLLPYILKKHVTRVAANILSIVCMFLDV